MKSMTGYGFSERQDGRFAVSCELKSYNNRYLDVSIYLPSYLGRLETRLRAWLSDRIARGSAELSVKVKELDRGVTIAVDRKAAAAYLEAFAELREVAGIDDPVRLSDLASLEGVLSADRESDVEGYWTAIQPVLEQAFAQYEATRKEEGHSAETDVLAQLARVDAAVAVFETAAPELEGYIKDELRKRFLDVMGNLVDENRVLAEVAVLLMKYTINEEIVRLKAHCSAFRKTVTQDPAPGKKLDFVCQEMNREVNTIGSKSVQLEVARAVIEAKDAIENIREQLRNVE
jgi:uncharacterized protein (TIGR00255 family)